MKFIRFLFSLLVLAVALAAILAIASFSPLVQTWAARLVLAHRPGVHGSLDSLSAGFGKVDVADLRLEVDGAVLTLPSLEARVPLTNSVWDRKVMVRSLVADGWTLDLSRASKPEDARAMVVVVPESGAGEGATPRMEIIPAQTVARVFHGIVSGWNLPCAVSLDGIDLEGDILVAAPSGGAPIRTHVIVKGGGMAGGREGTFTIEAAIADQGVSVNGLAANGHLVVAMESPRIISRIELKADLVAKGELLSGGLPLSADIAAVGGAGEEIYTLELSRGGRRLATVLAHFPEATRQWQGTWKVNLRDSDLEPFAPGLSLPPLAIAGDGKFDADELFTRVHSAGRLTATASRLWVLAPPLEGLATMELGARFDLTHSGQSLRVDHLSLSLAPRAEASDAGRRPAIVAQSLQPFDVDEKTGDLKTVDPRAEWMEVSIEGFPLARLSGPIGGHTFSGNVASGDFVVRTENGTFTLRTKTPLTATGVSAQNAGRMLGQGLDLSLLLSGDYSPQGWQVQCAPLAVSNAGRRLASVEAKASWVAGEDQPIAIAGTWKADLEALASDPEIAGVRWMRGRSASGDFTATVGSSTEVEGTAAVVGRDPSHSATASVSADVYADGSASFLVPVKVAFGSRVSDVSVEGTRTSEEEGGRLDVRLTGEKVSLDHLRLLAAPLAAAEGVRPTDAGKPDRIPFWGDLVGRVNVVFGRLRTGDYDFNDAEGILDFEPGSLRLEGGKGRLPDKTIATAEGSISFAAAAKFPYRLEAVTTVKGIDASPLFGATPSGQDPALEGHFSVARTFTGKGLNLDDLLAFKQEEFQVTSASTGGIVRLLKTSMVDAVPEVATPVSDTLGTVGSVVGSLFGVKKGSIGSVKNPVSKTADAVLNFASEISEIGYDRIAITATRGYDGTIRLVKMEMIGPDVHLTGSGQITGVEDLPLSGRPLSVELQFGARNGIAQLLSTAGLLSPHQDSLGYTMLNQSSIHFGGTLENIDQSAWHDLLVKAADRKPDAAKKSAP